MLDGRAENTSLLSSGGAEGAGRASVLGSLAEPGHGQVAERVVLGHGLVVDAEQRSTRATTTPVRSLPARQCTTIGWLAGLGHDARSPWRCWPAPMPGVVLVAGGQHALGERVAGRVEDLLHDREVVEVDRDRLHREPARLPLGGAAQVDHGGIPSPRSTTRSAGLSSDRPPARKSRRHRTRRPSAVAYPPTSRKLSAFSSSMWRSMSARGVRDGGESAIAPECIEEPRDAEMNAAVR